MYGPQVKKIKFIRKIHMSLDSGELFSSMGLNIHLNIIKQCIALEELMGEKWLFVVMIDILCRWAYLQEFLFDFCLVHLRQRLKWAFLIKIAKIHWRNLKIFFSRITGPISTKFGTKHPWVNGIQVCSNEEPFNSH